MVICHTSPDISGLSVLPGLRPSAHVFGQGLLCYGKGNGVANESHCAAVDTFTTRHSTANGISLPGKVTPVGFEPTPLRNGALSHRLRPLGQSVLGSTFWHQDICSATTLGVSFALPGVSWSAAEVRFFPPARPAPGSQPLVGRVSSWREATLSLSPVSPHNCLVKGLSRFGS